MSTTTSHWLLPDSDLVSMGVEMEKEDCLRAILWHLNAADGNGMEYVLNNPRFQVVWRKACKIFQFYSWDTAKCSASNIEAFRDMVAQTYPEMYQKLSEDNMAVISNIKEAALSKSTEILSNWETDSIHIGPVELLEQIWVDGFGESTPQTRALFNLLHHELEAEAYLSHLNQYVATNFIREESIWKFLNHKERCISGGWESIGRYLNPSTTLIILLSRLNDWWDIFRWDGDTYKIALQWMIDNAPQEFLELLRSRWKKEEIDSFSKSTIISLMENPNTLESTVFPIALILLDIETENEKKKKERFHYVSSHEDSNSDKIHFVLAKRFPKRYIAMLEMWLKWKELASSEWWDLSSAISIGNTNTHLSIATSHPSQYVSLLWKMNDEQILSALKVYIRKRNGEERRTVLDTLIQANLWSQVINLIFQLKTWDMYISDILYTLADSNPKELVQEISKMSGVEMESKLNLFDNALEYRRILQRLIIKWEWAQVLEILKEQDWRGINIHMHALLYKYVQREYLDMAQAKGFDFESVAREMVNGSTKPIDELVAYLAHYAFSESAFHARDSYNEFLLDQAT